MLRQLYRFMVSNRTKTVDVQQARKGRGAGGCTGMEDNKERNVRNVSRRKKNRTRDTGDRIQ